MHASQWWFIYVLAKLSCTTIVLPFSGAIRPTHPTSRITARHSFRQTVLSYSILPLRPIANPTRARSGFRFVRSLAFSLYLFISRCPFPCHSFSLVPMFPFVACPSLWTRRARSLAFSRLNPFPQWFFHRRAVFMYSPSASRAPCLALFDQRFLYPFRASYYSQPHPNVRAFS